MMSVVRYGLIMLAGAGTNDDPHQKDRAHIEVSVTRQKLKKSGAR